MDRSRALGGHRGRDKPRTLGRPPIQVFLQPLPGLPARGEGGVGPPAQARKWRGWSHSPAQGRTEARVSASDPMRTWPLRGDMLQSSEGTGTVSEATRTAPDWSAWSQEAVRLMEERNVGWIRSYSLEGCAYRWSLGDAQFVFRSESDEVVFDICVMGLYPNRRERSAGRGPTRRFRLARNAPWREFASSARLRRLIF
jgi:hypothetical protein